MWNRRAALGTHKLGSHELKRRESACFYPAMCSYTRQVWRRQGELNLGHGDGEESESPCRGMMEHQRIC